MVQYCTAFLKMSLMYLKNDKLQALIVGGKDSFVTPTLFILVCYMLKGSHISDQ